MCSFRRGLCAPVFAPLRAKRVFSCLLLVVLSVISSGRPSWAQVADDDDFLLLMVPILASAVQHSTITTLTSSANPAEIGSTVTLTATVTGRKNVPIATVTFLDNGVAIAGCEAMPLPAISSGLTANVTCAASNLGLGTHSLVARYAGSDRSVPNWTNPSQSAELVQTINSATTSLGLTSSNPSATIGTTITLTASLYGYGPTGTIRFAAGGASIANTSGGNCDAVPLSGSGTPRTAVCNTNASSLGIGSFSMVASYVGDTYNTLATSAPVTQSVSLAGTTTTLGSTRNPAYQGKPFTLTATVSGSNGPTGTVNFVDTTNNATICSNRPLVIGSATCGANDGANPWTLGGHTVVATYSGDGGNAASSGQLTQTINVLPATTTSLTTSASPAISASLVTFTAHVAGAPNGASPGGTVAFTANGASIAGCDARLLNANGDATCQTNSLTTDSAHSPQYFSIIATYGGDDNNAASNNVPALTQAIKVNTPPTIAFDASMDRNGVAGTPLTLSVSAADPDQTSALSVQFTISPIGSSVAGNWVSGTSSYRANWTPATQGTYTVTARATDAQGAYTETSQTVTVLNATAPNAEVVAETYPAVAQMVGTTPGSFAVTESGAASYSIPIVVPPGTAGMQPSLALSYSSQGGVGQLGVGWNLSGLSVVTRCPSTNAQDGKKAGINYDTNMENDHYCLDGVRLVEVGRTSNADNNYSPDYIQIEYRTEIEGYSRIIGYAEDPNSGGNVNGRYPDGNFRRLIGPNRFKVWTKSGQVMEYGSRWWVITAGWQQINLQLQAGLDPSQDAAYARSNAAKVWVLDRVSDRSGNYLTVDYAGRSLESSSAPDNVKPRPFGSAPLMFALNVTSPPPPIGALPDVEYWPASIKYYAAGVPEQTLGAYNEVRFTYQDLPQDQWQRFYDSGSGATPLIKQLTQIDTYANTFQRVRSYVLSYETGNTGRQRLKQVQEIGADGTTLAPTVFNWTDSTKQFGPAQTVSGPQVYDPSAGAVLAFDVRAGDVDGDGRSDLVSRTRKQLTDPMTGFPYWQHSWQTCFSRNGSFTCDDRFSFSTQDPEPGMTWLMADVDGDGRADLIIHHFNSVTICRSTDTGWAIDPGTGQRCTTTNLPYQRDDFSVREFQGDVDGDGRVDYVYFNTNNDVVLCLNKATGMQCSTQSIAPVCATQDDPLCAMPDGDHWQNQIVGADINGDGKLDLIIRQHADNLTGDSNDSWRTCLSDFGPGGSNRFICHKGWAHGVNGNPQSIAVLDFNGDGLADMATYRPTSPGYDTNHWQVCLSGGDGAFEYTDPAIHYDSAQGTWINSSGAVVNPLTEPRCKAWVGPPVDATKVLYGDFNGDGRTDILYRPDGWSWNVCRSTGNNFAYSGNPSSPCEDWSNGLNRDANVYDYVVIGDFDGDGRSDILVWQGQIRDPGSSDSWHDGGWHLIPAGRDQNGSVSAFGDLLQGVATGLNATTGITYAPLTDPSVYAKGADDTLADQELNIQSPLYVVKQTQGDNGVGGVFTTSYFYEGLRGRTDGRGLYGFLKKRSRDDSNVVIETEYQRVEANESYADVWAKVGRPKVVRKYAPTNPAYALNQSPAGILLLMNRTTTTWQVNQSRTCSGWYCPGTPIPREALAANVLQESWDLNGVALPSTNTANSLVDPYGNPKTITVSTATASGPDGYSKTTQSNYFNDAPGWIQGQEVNWILGRLSDSTVTSTAPDQLAIVRKSAFTYQGYYGASCGGAVGYLCTEVIEPNRYRDGTFSWQQTAYQYDGYGNKTQATLTFEDIDANGDVSDTSRTSQTEYATYDAANNWAYYGGRFPTRSIKIYNPADINDPRNQVETRSFGVRFGTPISVTGPNGIKTEMTYDGFGHKVLETVRDANGNPLAQTFTAAEACNQPGLAAPGCQAGSTELYRVRTKTSGGAESRTYYDRLQREVRTEGKAFNPSAWANATIQYDTLGRKWVLTKPVANGDTDGSLSTTLYYDALGRIDHQTTTVAGGTPTTTATTAYNGLTTTVTLTGTGIASRASSKTVNSQGQTVTITDPSPNGIDPPGQTNYHYDAVGSLVQVIGPTGITESMAYDLRGRKKSQSNLDSGAWYYDYNGAGELVRQYDAKGQATRQFYDPLGRMIERREYAGADNPNLAAFVTVWNYDQYADGSACSQGIGKLCETRFANLARGSNAVIGSALDLAPGSANSPVRELARFDGSGRALQGVTEVHELIAEQPTVKSFESLTTYDANSRPDKLVYPSGLTIQHFYSGWSGQLNQIAEWSNGATGAVHWTASSRYADGQIQWMNVGNVTTHKRYDSLGRIQSVNTANGAVQSASYSFDVLGNLSSRSDNAQNGQLAESFTYDALNRLTSDGAGSTSYDLAGNIQCRSGVGCGYQYYAGTHRVSSAGGYALQYDSNGNVYQFSGNATKTLVYTPFNLPSQVVAEGGTLDYIYNGSHARVKETSRTPQGADNGYTYYIGGFEEHKRPDQVIEQRHYLNTPEGPVGIVTWRRNGIDGSNGVNDARYWHKDHLGSIVAITDANGVVMQHYTFDAWGRRAPPTPNTNSDPNELDPNHQLYAEERGYTGHEHMLEAELINMNGRLYFARIGRMLQADPIIQSPLDSQNYNRYSYTVNNPLRYTDPSGYVFGFDDFLIAMAVIGTARATNIIDTQQARMLVGIAVAFWMGPAGMNIAGPGNGFASAVAGGFAAGGIAGGNIESAIQGAFFAGAFYGVGELSGAHGFTGTEQEFLGSSAHVAQTVGHAVVGCMQSAAAGGSCQSGAMSAGFAAAVGPALPGEKGSVTRLTATMVAGGASSKLGGAKFANGAMTAAFGQLFNDLYGNDPRSNRARALFFAPAGDVRSSFGHFAVEIDGMAYSLNHDGKMSIVPSEAYIMKTNEFRSTIAVELNLSSADRSALKQFLGSYTNPNVDGYGFVANNCTLPLQAGLAAIGKPIDFAISPMGIMGNMSMLQSLVRAGLTGNVTSYRAHEIRESQ